MSRRMALMIGGAGAAVVALTATAGIAGASSFNAPAESPHYPIMKNIGAEATYGIRNGQPFMHLIKGHIVGKYKLSEIKHVARLSRTSALCTEYISDVSKENGDYPFQWETQQTCSGPFGAQRMHTQMWRSSYRGPLGYGDWSATDWVSEPFVSRNWQIDCNYGTGYYDYYPVMYGESDGTGTGPTIRSDNDLNAHCGTEPPGGGGPY